MIRSNRIPAGKRPLPTELAVEESLGTLIYLVTLELTATLRERATDALVAPEQAVVLDTDPARAGAIARGYLQMYLPLPNYTNNWLRAGYEPADLEHCGSHRLVDALVASGSLDTVARRVHEHYDAGADNVCLQVFGAGGLLSSGGDCSRPRSGQPRPVDIRATQIWSASSAIACCNRAGMCSVGHMPSADL